MLVKRFADAKAYEAANHRACTSLRLFGAEAGGTKELIVGLSHFLPGGGAGPDASPPEKVYFVLRRRAHGHRRRQGDRAASRTTPARSGRTRSREIINRGNEVCTIVVAVAPPPK